MQSKKLYVETPAGGEYPPLRNKTIFAASKCADIVTMDEGAIEHPMSTHSASDGTSWTARGWRYIASILMILTLCVGNTWAANYIEFTAVVKCFNGATGQVLVKSGGGKTTATVVTSTSSLTGGSGWSASDNNSTAVLTYNSGGATSKYTWGALSGDGSVFEGWYTDAACTVAAPTAFNSAKRTSENVVYVIEGTSVSGYSAATSSTNRCYYTLYAKFSKEASGNKFKPQLTATSSNFSQGHIAISMTSTGSLSKVAQTAGPAEYTLTEESSLSQTFSVRAQPMRGYKFVNWTVAGTPRTTDKATSDLPLESFTVTLTDQMTPGANSVISNNDVVTANFVADELKDFKIQKEANVGTVSGSYTYYYIISGGNSTTHTEPISSLALADTEKDYQLYGADQITLTAAPAEGYNFSGWYVRRESQPDELLTTNATVTTYLTEDNLTFVPVFALDISGLVIDENDNFLVGYSTCTSLEQAIAAASQSQHKTILQLKDYTVPAGNYVIPAGVTLLIPYSENQSTPATVLPRVGNVNATDSAAYRTLTLGANVHLDVYGTIEVSGRQATGVSGSGGEEGIGCPTGGYGCLYMSAGSSITLNNGALLRGWGYVLGDRDGQGKYQCEIDARRGAIVREQFQIMDWKGGDYTVGMTYGVNSYPSERRVLPINQYYIQNVEVPVKYRPGAKLQANASVFVNGTFYGMKLENIIFNIDNVGIIGARYKDPNKKDDSAIFLMDDEDDSEDTWVRKYYDVDNDKQVYEINNAASLGSLTLNVFNVPVSSVEYKLPITNNFKIHLLNGTMDVTQRTEILPGAEIEIAKESTMAILDTVILYMWDKDDWGNFVSTTRNPNSTFTFGKGTTVKWRPGGRPIVRRDKEGKVIISDAKLTMHGSVNVEGYLKTTTHGASITSTIADAGTITFKKSTPADADAGVVWQVKSLPAKVASSYQSVACTSAQLINEDGTFTSTADTTATEDDPISFCFIDFNKDGKGEWKALATTGCFVKDENDVWYIKPQEYVAISQGAAPVEEADHTYRDHYAGTNRIFILAAEGNCQWWEVRAVPGHPDLFECINENNHTFFYYDESAGNWKEKKFKVSWVNWDGSPVNYTNRENEQVNYYMVTYGTVPEWLSANPKHVDDDSHTYSFKGWLPTPAAVTEDVTYTAQYEERDRMYAITFNDESDELIQLLYCKLGEIPVCTKYDAAANNKVWKTASGEAIGAVAGDVTYKLFAKETKANYTIRFVNWNGDVLQSGSVAAGSIPSAPTYPTKDPDDLHSYSFKEWNPAVVAANADATYTATYNVGSRGYTVLWKKDGVTIETDENVPYGEVPEYNGATPAKAGFTYIGWSPAVAAVTGNATYTAQFMENRTISTAQTIDANTEVNTITVETGGALTINNEVTLSAENLILKSTSEASGQIIPKNNTSKLNAINAYYDLTLGAPQARHWNAFGVPWVVNLDVAPLIELNDAGEPVGTLVLGRDYDIVVYNGATRASQGPGYWCWEFLEHHVHNLTPGKGYMIQFIKDVTGIRFTKVSGTDFFYKGNVYLDENASTNADNAGWAAMANPMPFHATMTNGPTVGYVHNGGEIGSDGYVPYDLAGGKFFVGKTVYVQAGEGGDDISPVYANGSVDPISPAAAPARRTRATDKKYLSLKDYYQVGVANESVEGGKVYVLPEEEKENKYVIGHDLAQFGMSTAVPQVWVNRYDTKLALNTTALVGETAEFPMGVYAPAAGEYTISLNAQPSEDYTVYLTRDGQVIWNLSDGAFVTTLTSGIQSNYGVRLVRKAPQVATGLDEAVVDAKNETRKVLIDNQVFIIREGHVYTVDGQIVK